MGAVAAGILGPEAPVEFVSIPLQELFASLANGTIDIMLFGATHTMERSLFLVRESHKRTFALSEPSLTLSIRNL